MAGSGVCYPPFLPRVPEVMQTICSACGLEKQEVRPDGCWRNIYGWMHHVFSHRHKRARALDRIFKNTKRQIRLIRKKTLGIMSVSFSCDGLEAISRKLDSISVMSPGTDMFAYYELGRCKDFIMSNNYKKVWFYTYRNHLAIYSNIIALDCITVSRSIIVWLQGNSFQIAQRNWQRNLYSWRYILWEVSSPIV